MAKERRNINYQLEEYKMLREEILFFMNKDTTLLTCLFASVTAILFFALEWKIPEGCILTFLIIIPIGSKLAYHQREMAKISAYMEHYLEVDIDIKWETFVSKLSSFQKRPKTAKYLKFSECLMMAIVSFLSYIYMAWHNKIWEECGCIFKIEIIILIALFTWTFLISKKIYNIKEYRMRYKQIMKDIQL